MKLKSALWLVPCIVVSSLVMSPAFADNNPMQRVDFQTDVSAVLPNDILRARLSIELNDKDSARLARNLTLAMNDAMGKAKPYTNVKISTGNQQNWPIYNDKQRLDGWRGRAEITLESKDFKAASELLAQLQQGLQLQHIDFAVSEESRKAIEKTLTTQAITAFREKADTVRSAWGAKSYQLVNMNLNSGYGGQPRPPMMMSAMKMADAESAPVQDMAAGESRLTLSVNGTIQLQP
ncbi:MAG: SIMPL domain-containing protein [Moraxellaceae bacterium]|nr:SIMPL domain-containing protein [Moraxellaceae bacterium]MDZ4385813.1 SIMPL domain-containing protein [Moraxellaceae bacterium]